MTLVGRKGQQVQVLPPDVARGHEPLVGVKVIMFNRRMRKRREACNLSQGELATQCGMSQAHISEIELLKAVPTFEQMNIIATALYDEPEHMFPDELHRLKRNPTLDPDLYLAPDGIRLVSGSDPERDAEAAERLLAAREVLTPLLEGGHVTPRERHILTRRWGLDGEGTHTLEEVAQDMHVTAQRVRQLEAHTLEKMRRRALPVESFPCPFRANQKIYIAVPYSADGFTVSHDTKTMKDRTDDPEVATGWVASLHKEQWGRAQREQCAAKTLDLMDAAMTRLARRVRELKMI